MSEEQFKALMIAASAGDARAYHALLLLCANRLRSYFRRRLVGRDADVEDLVQESLMAIHRKRASYSPALPFTAWLHGIARYRLIDFLRKSGRRETLTLDDIDELAVEGGADVIGAQADVARLLAELTPKQSAAISLTRIEGLSVRETADRTAQSESSVKVNVHRGLLRLRSIIDGGK